jgi:hypothetical protein
MNHVQDEKRRVPLLGWLVGAKARDAWLTNRGKGWEAAAEVPKRGGGEGPEEAADVMKNATEGKGSCGVGGGLGSVSGGEGTGKGAPIKGSGPQESPSSSAVLDRGPMTGHRRWPSKQRRLKKKTPKVPLAVCISIGIFWGCTTTDKG